MLTRILRILLGLAVLLIATVAWRRPLYTPDPSQVLPRLVLSVALAAIALVGAGRLVTRLDRRWFLVLLGVAAILPRAVWIAGVRNEQVSDFAIYHELAVALESGLGFAVTGPVGIEDLETYVLGPERSLPYTTALRAPGAPMLGAALYRLFGADVRVVKIFNVLLATGSCLLLYALLARRGFEAEGRIASLLWALYPSSIFSANLFSSEVPFVLLLLGSACVLHPDASRGRSLLHGLVCGLMGLMRALLGPVVLASSVAILAGESPRRGALRLGAYLLALSLVLAPWAIRNYRHFESFIPVCTNEGIFFGNHTQRQVRATVRARSEDYNRRLAAWRSLDSEATRAQGGYQLGLHNLGLMLGEGPGWVLARLYDGITEAYSNDGVMLHWATLNRHGRAKNPGPVNALSHETIELLRNVALVFYLLIVALALAGLLTSRSQAILANRELLFLASLFAILFSAGAVIRGHERIHYPQMPLLVILAATGSTWLGAQSSKIRARVRRAAHMETASKSAPSNQDR